MTSLFLEDIFDLDFCHSPVYVICKVSVGLQIGAVGQQLNDNIPSMMI